MSSQNIHRNLPRLPLRYRLLNLERLRVSKPEPLTISNQTTYKYELTSKRRYRLLHDNKSTVSKKTVQHNLKPICNKTTVHKIRSTNISRYTPYLFDSTVIRFSFHSSQHLEPPGWLLFVLANLYLALNPGLSQIQLLSILFGNCTQIHMTQKSASDSKGFEHVIAVYRKLPPYFCDVSRETLQRDGGRIIMHDIFRNCLVHG